MAGNGNPLGCSPVLLASWHCRDNIGLYSSCVDCWAISCLEDMAVGLVIWIRPALSACLRLGFVIDDFFVALCCPNKLLPGVCDCLTLDQRTWKLAVRPIWMFCNLALALKGSHAAFSTCPGEKFHRNQYL